MVSVQPVIRGLGQPGDLGWVVMAHGELYAAEFGWDTTFEALVVRIVADYANDHSSEREAAWIAELDGRRVGCVFCVSAGDTTAQLRILLVDPCARGGGLGGRLVDECVKFARAVGYTRMKLWTNHPLVAARAVYLRRGFRLVDEEPHHSFGVDLVGHVYELDLSTSNPAEAPGTERRHGPVDSAAQVAGRPG
jgi:GNAT superfamily N-acetyltransferase